MTKIAHQLLAASMAAPEYWGAVGDGVTGQTGLLASEFSATGEISLNVSYSV